MAFREVVGTQIEYDGPPTLHIWLECGHVLQQRLASHPVIAPIVNVFGLPEPGKLCFCLKCAEHPVLIDYVGERPTITGTMRLKKIGERMIHGEIFDVMEPEKD